MRRLVVFLFCGLLAISSVNLTGCGGEKESPEFQGEKALDPNFALEQMGQDAKDKKEK